MFAITFDMDTTALPAAYHAASRHNAYSDIGKVLHRHGFIRQQGSVYFGDDTVDAVRVRDIRMLRIEDNNDLMPAVDSVRP